MEIATSLAKKKGININSNLKKQGIHLDRTVVIKKIPMDMPKEIIVTALAEFGEIKLIKIQLIGLWQKAVVEFAKLASRDQFRALLFTLLVEMTAHNLGTLLERVNGKTYIINCSLNSGNRICCAVIGFESKDAMESAYCTELIFGGIKLSWVKLDLVCCEKCGCLGHFALEYNASTLPIANPSKFHVFISRSAAFVVLLASPSGDPYFNSGFRSDLSSFGSSGIKGNAPVVSGIMHRLNGVELVLITQVVSPATSVPTLALLDADIVLNVLWSSLSSSSPVLENKMANLDLNSLKVLTSKVGSLESKMMAFEVSIGSILEKLNLLCINLGSLKDIVCWHKNSGNMILIITETKLRSDIMSWIMNRFDRLWVFTFGLDIGFCGAGVAIIMNISLAQHVLKVDEIPGHLIFMCLLFKNKLSVTILGFQAADINSMVFKTVNSSSFVVLGGNFNKNESSKSASFKFCLSLGLVNIFDEHLLAETSTWSNFRGVEKVIDFFYVSKFFDTDHKSVFISIGLGGLLDTHLISICRQANRDQWKFKLKNADDLLARLNMFKEARVNGDLNTMCKILEKAIVQSADTVFSRIWYIKASKIDSMVLNDVSLMKLIKHLLVIKIEYHKSKYYESKIAKDAAIRKAIDYCMENFCSNKRKMIKSILEHPFCKVVLNHLVVDDELVIEPNEVKLKVDKIMESKFNVLYDNNFLVLKSTLTQSPIFAIGSVVENALEKNRELCILGHLFDHRFLDLQILGWSSLNSLQFSVKLGPVPYWFSLTSDFMNNSVSLGVKTATATKEDVVYTDGSLRCASSVEVVGRAAAYFLAVNADIGVKVAGLLSSTLTELQAVVLALKCVPSSCSVVLYLNSQFAINAYISKTSSTTPDFHNQCWIERLQIVNLLKGKNISIKAKHKAEMEKTGLVGDNGVVSGLSSSVVSILLTGIVHMLGVIKSFAVRFDKCKLCCFFSGLDDNAFVIISV
ncbi:hypothetical protein G9A89_023984 [Geosiphon pyriformis]|nr:hypothetical protein G9A89_023984 [Geosiphon pyriformis]